MSSTIELARAADDASDAVVVADVTAKAVRVSADITISCKNEIIDAVAIVAQAASATAAHEAAKGITVDALADIDLANEAAKAAANVADAAEAVAVAADALYDAAVAQEKG